MKEENTPFFSVIIPNYNTELLIEKCLDSFVKQKFKNFEIVITDDCSSDNSISVIKKIKEESGLNIKVIINEINVGPAKSREKAIKISRGKYIAFCDSDDWYDENYLELAYEEINKTNCDICFLGFKTVLEKKGKTYTREQKINPRMGNMTKKQILTMDVDSLCTMVINRDIFRDIMFLDLRNGEDMALIPLLITRSESFSVVCKCPYNYLYREGSASLSPNLNVVNSLVASYEYIYDSLSSQYADECEYLGIRNLLYGGLLNLFKYRFDICFAQKIIDEFERKYPHWRDNCYQEGLPKYKKIFLNAVKHRAFFMMWILAKIHKIITR